MAENTKIEWTHHTFNPVRGCKKVSDGCKNCYAEKMSKRNPETLGVWGDDGVRAIAAESYWKQPVKWNRDAEKDGERRRVFCASLADVFEDRPEWIEPRARLFDLIRQTPNLDWLLLTKRPDNIIHSIYQLPLDFWPEETREMARNWLYGLPPKNVWLGTSVENQEQADKRIPELLKVPAKVRFLSCEPLLGPVDIGRWLCCARCGRGEVARQDAFGTWFHQTKNGCFPCATPQVGRGEAVSNIHWVIVGGESGPNARPMHPDWARRLRDQCKAANVPIFIKQMGSEYARRHHFSDPKGGDWLEWAAEFRFREFPNAKTA